MVLAHLHPNALLTLAIFQYLCEAFVGVLPLVALFRVSFEARLDAGGAISGCLSFLLHPSMVTRFLPMPNREWDEWRVNLCLVRFSEEDDLVAYAEPTGFPEALSVWTSPASMAYLEAAVERIQNLRKNHLAAHHVVNSFVRQNIMMLQRCSYPNWEALSRNHPMRLHRDSPSEDEILRVSNFLTGGNQTELLWSQRIRALIRLEAEEHAAIIASMPLCDEWGPVVAPVTQEVADGVAGEELTTA
jgi:hypothetical protein